MYHNSLHIVGTHLFELKEFKHFFISSVSLGNRQLALSTSAMIIRTDSNILVREFILEDIHCTDPASCYILELLLASIFAHSVRLSAIP